jgi:hypothetical protein
MIRYVNPSPKSWVNLQRPSTIRQAGLQELPAKLCTVSVVPTSTCQQSLASRTCVLFGKRLLSQEAVAVGLLY